MIALSSSLDFLVYNFQTLESTQETAKEMAEGDAEEGSVVVAEEQTQGRGRDGNEWESPPGGVYLSLILRPSIPAEDVHKLVLLAGNACASALRKITDSEIQIKWPNDLMHGNQKVGGILCETSSIGRNLEYVIIGVGINTNVSKFSKDLRKTATSIHEISGKEVDNDSFRSMILEDISKRYDGFPRNFPQLISEWKEYQNTIGRRVKLDGKRVNAVGISEDGCLVIEDNKGIQREVSTGTIEYM